MSRDILAIRIANSLQQQSAADLGPEWWLPWGYRHYLNDGTPLLAIAAGVVAPKGEGGQVEGIYIWLRHAPEETGLTYGVFSKYQHFDILPELPIGAKVAMGQVIGRSGGEAPLGGALWGL
ncbi:MAG: M23 family metallopeptidase [candidate division KSB1 bacterium]|nr:M23 family metallopeptidase [candidate division KSB1 bacterium]